MALLFGSSRTFAEDPRPLPRLYTNELFIEDVTRPTSLDLDDIYSVLDYVLGQLPDTVHVFPTENYYYFYFYQGGIRYAGNFRLDVEARDNGLVEFIYFKDTTDWAEDDTDHHATLGSNDGVLVEKVRDLVYRVTYAGKAVTFELNDLSEVRPPEGALGKSETFLGPVADESGIRFFLVFDSELKIFHYVLDETVAVADELNPVTGMSHISIGMRTGFAFFDDVGLDRKLLVGVFGPNADVNNYLDGPFDQLPDNFLAGDELKKALLLARPDLTPSSVDRLGISPDADFRESISPYMDYVGVKDLAPAEECAAKEDPSAVHLCLNALFPE